MKNIPIKCKEIEKYIKTNRDLYASVLVNDVPLKKFFITFDKTFEIEHNGKIILRTKDLEKAVEKYNELDDIIDL